MKAIKIKILEHLLDSNQNNNILTISKSIKTNYSNTHQNIKDMEEIKTLKIGRNNVILLKKVLTKNLFEAETNRTNHFLKSEDIRNIHRNLNKTTSPFFIALVFGSRLKNKNYNDIDICVITDDKKIKNQITENLEILSYKIDLHIFTSSEFLDMINSKKSNLGNEIIKKNIILKGIENYYELLKWESNNENLKDSSEKSNLNN